MPTKYVRPNFREFASGVRRRFRQDADRAGQESPAVPNTRAMILIGITVLVVISLVSDAVSRSLSLDAPSLTHGEGVVVQKEYREINPGETAYALEIEISTADGSTLAARVAIDAESWGRVAEGDVVNVAYQQRPGKAGLHVHEISLKPDGP